MLSAFLMDLGAPLRVRAVRGLAVAVIAAGVTTGWAINAPVPATHAVTHALSHGPDAVAEPVADAPAPAPAQPEAAAVAAPPANVVHLPLLGGGSTSSSAPPPLARPGSFISVPAVGLRVAVADYTDCSGDTAMTRATAVHFTCSPNHVTTIVGHNPGVFTPLTHSHTGDEVHYQHDGVDEAWVISEVHRVSPQEANAYSQDNSYTHAVLATCAEPDSSAYWIYIAVPQGTSHVSGGTQASASAPGNPAAPPQSVAPSPRASPSPAGTTLPGGITVPPPPH